MGKGLTLDIRQVNEILVDALSEQAIKTASLICKRDHSEAREIIWCPIETHEIEQHLTVFQFQEYLQNNARPKFLNNCPVCEAETPPFFT